jgi:hypothetical protein
MMNTKKKNLIKKIGIWTLLIVVVGAMIATIIYPLLSL